ncbi:hypothetical protein EXIGLDRAFT_836676 [Exidia glandulosa HHB12029]|uniref:Uncharacterized protein n=1 Tax=Exidia glandulosa HHB12029 TaxID=1314781 RepID=A0A166AI52_EXIGL|nr:hypothetical protein EXIGLDRAFT_836676 [Exidia glandulosa HHB12029]
MALAFTRFYNRSFDRSPYTTLAIANSGLSVLGDCLAQAVQVAGASDGETVRYDPVRSARFAVFGLVMGPFIGRWVKFLEQQFPMNAGKTTAGNLLALTKRVASDQILMAPLGLTIFLGSMGVMEGRSSGEIGLKYHDLFWPALYTNWKVWPAIQFVNFKFVPLAFRVPFQSTCGCFWTLYLSMLNSSDSNQHPKSA